MIQLHITMIPSITKYRKFRKKEWVKNAKIPFESLSEGIYALMWEGFDWDTGECLKGFKVVMNCCLFKEAEQLEDELRENRIILTKIETLKKV